MSSWINKSPRTRFRDGIWSKLDKKTLDGFALGNGVTNITAIFALPDGTVLNAVPGYLDVESFEAEADFAIELRAKVVDARGRLRDGAAKVIAEAHRGQAKTGRGPYEAKAHTRLAESGILTLDAIGPGYFDDFQARSVGW